MANTTSKKKADNKSTPKKSTTAKKHTDKKTPKEPPKTYIWD